jgi:hypothetical protein
MKAIVIRAYGGPEVMKLDDVEHPRLDGLADERRDQGSIAIEHAQHLLTAMRRLGVANPTIWRWLENWCPVLYSAEAGRSFSPAYR